MHAFLDADFKGFADFVTLFAERKRVCAIWQILRLIHARLGFFNCQRAAHANGVFRLNFDGRAAQRLPAHVKQGNRDEIDRQADIADIDGLPRMRRQHERIGGGEFSPLP